MLELGASCRKARESKNLSLEHIAAETRISKRFLAAIEDEQFEDLPGGIFNRGFIRTYAERLGIDPDEAILSYEKSFRVVETETPRQEIERPAKQAARIPVYYAAGIGLLILFVGFYIWSRPSEPSHVTAVTASTPPAEVPVPVAKDIPAPTVEDVIKPPAETPPAPVAPSPVAAPAVPAPSTVPAPAPAVKSAVVVELEVREDSWFQLSSDGAAVVVSEVLTPGTVRRYTANSSIDVSIGNAAGVKMKVNGQAVSSLGRSGQVRKLTITPATSAASLVMN